jgi:hypothetical protein
MELVKQPLSQQEKCRQKTYSVTYWHIHIFSLIGVLYGEGWQHCAGAQDEHPCYTRDGGHDATGVLHA